MSLQEGIYLITNVRAPIAVDLNGGLSNIGTPVQAWEEPKNSDITLLNKLWLVKPTQRKDLQTYSICNLRSGTHMSLDEKNPTCVVGDYPNAFHFGEKPETLTQEWQFIKVGDSYRIKNGQAKTSLNLESGKEANGTPITVWGDSDTPNQLWNLKSYSVTYDDILAALQDSPYGMDDFKYFPLNTLYFVVPQPLLTEIWNTTALPGRATNQKLRSQIFSGDDYAIAFKAAVNDWAFYNIKADHFSPLCGVHVGERQKNTVCDYWAYNWTLSDDRKSVLFYETKMEGPGTLLSSNAAWASSNTPVEIFVGGTSGIGKGIAQAFARHIKGNTQIVIVGRAIALPPTPSTSASPNQHCGLGTPLDPNDLGLRKTISAGVSRFVRLLRAEADIDISGFNGGGFC
ncbi:hypothetical protein C8R43DRAFT_1230915 [Mycena crocata]|nr:hypothetical protein C8R43DRAFT_1230915 [Mycena crocata]